MSQLVGLWTAGGVGEGAASVGELVARLDELAATLNDCPVDRTVRWAASQGCFLLRLLDLTPQDAEAFYPMQTPASSVALLADARLDDRENLCRKLGAMPTAPDSQLLFEAWQRWGEQCLEHLVGDFVLVVADTKEGTLWVARDALGVRPLYYAMVTPREGAPKVLMVSSDLVPLHAALGSDAALSRDLALSFLGDGQDAHTEATFYLQIKKLPPGHVLRVSAAGLTVERWWKPVVGRPLDASPAACVSALRKALEGVVGDRLRARGPVACHVSGGLDTAVLASLAVSQARAQGTALPQLMRWGRPGEQEGDAEARRVQSLAQTLETDLAVVSPHASDLRDFVTQDPTLLPLHPSLLHERPLQVAARARGARLLLAGWGGNEGFSFGGDAFCADWMRQGRWGVVPHEARQQAVAVTLRSRFSSLLGGAKPLMPVKVTLPPLEAVGPELLHPRVAPASRPFRVAWPEFDDVASWQWAIFGHPRLTGTLEAYAASAARRGVAYTFPLLDRRLIELVLRLPASLYRDTDRARLVARRVSDAWVSSDFFGLFGHEKTDFQAYERSLLVNCLRSLDEAFDPKAVHRDRADLLELDNLVKILRDPEACTRTCLLRALRALQWSQGLRPAAPAS